MKINQQIRWLLRITLLTVIGGMLFAPIPCLGNPRLNTLSAMASQQTSKLSDQQIGILVGLAINPDWVKEQSQANSLVYGVVKPSDSVPAGINTEYSFLMTADNQAPFTIYYENIGRRVIIKYTPAANSKLVTKTVRLSTLVHRYDATKGQRARLAKYLKTLRTE